MGTLRPLTLSPVTAVLPAVDGVHDETTYQQARLVVSSGGVGASLFDSRGTKLWTAALSHYVRHSKRRYTLVLADGATEVAVDYDCGCGS